FLPMINDSSKPSGSPYFLITDSYVEPSAMASNAFLSNLAGLPVHLKPVIILEIACLSTYATVIVTLPLVQEAPAVLIPSVLEEVVELGLPNKALTCFSVSPPLPLLIKSPTLIWSNLLLSSLF